MSLSAITPRILTSLGLLFNFCIVAVNHLAEVGQAAVRYFKGISIENLAKGVV